MTETTILQGERIDNIGFGGLRLIQKPEDCCFGVDAVLLAGFAARGAAGREYRIMDLGTGTGVIPILLSHKTEAAEICGLEVQPESHERACRNLLLNGLSGRVRMLLGDVAELAAETEPPAKTGWEAYFGKFDMVVTNPPYMPFQGGQRNRCDARAIARHETTAGLEEFVRASARLLRDRGELYMVHRPSRLADICVFCRKYKLEPKELRFVSPHRERAPNILLLRCAKNGGPELRLLDPLFVYESDGSYTREVLDIYEK